MGLQNVVSLCGIFVFLLVAWGLSSSRRTIQLRVVLWGLGLQFLLGIFVFLSPQGRAVFHSLNDLVYAFLGFAGTGASFVFGKLAKQEASGFILAFQVLPIVIFFAALMGLLYYSGVMQFIIRGFTWLFTRTMGISGAESLSVSSNIFVGIESAFIVRPYYNGMTRSELATVLAGCMATVASTVLGIYAFVLKDNFPSIAGHLISASLLTAPAVIVIAKLMIPETDHPETLGQVVHGEYDRPGHWVEAIYVNAMEGVKLAVGIAAMLIALIALLNAVNTGVGWKGGHLGIQKIKIKKALGFVFYPFVLLMGVSFEDAHKVATLLGMRVIATELPAYGALAKYLATEAISPRSGVIAAYALCGFAHIPAIAIFVGGIAAIAPKRATELGQLSMRALVMATLACMMTGAIAGLFYTGQKIVLTKKEAKEFKRKLSQKAKKAKKEKKARQKTQLKTNPRTQLKTNPRTQLKTNPRTQPKTNPRTLPKTSPRTQPKTNPRTLPKTSPRTQPKTSPRTLPKTKPVIRPR